MSPTCKKSSQSSRTSVSGVALRECQDHRTATKEHGGRTKGNNTAASTPCQMKGARSSAVCVVARAELTAGGD
jgi:hypothetical protein